MTDSTENTGARLAEELRSQSEADAETTAMDAVLDAARAGRLTEDHLFRLFGRLWTLERLMYYVYGGWAMGINLNEYPPMAAYLFGKQIYDESTQEMQYLDEILRRKWSRTQTRAFDHAYGRFDIASRVGSYVFCLRALANYPQNLRIAALNLGPKVIELAWTNRFAETFPEDAVRQIFASQLAETRSHVLMGKLQVERFIRKGVETDLAKRLCAETRRDYLFVLEEIARFVLGMAEQEVRDPVGFADID